MNNNYDTSSKRNADENIESQNEYSEQNDLKKNDKHHNFGNQTVDSIKKALKEAKNENKFTEVKIVEENQKLKSELENLRNIYTRIAADYENEKRRNAQEMENTRRYAVTNFAKDLMSVVDNLSRALEHIPKDLNEEIKNFVKGVEMTKDELQNVFEKNSITPISPKIGDKFDYNIHYAISQVADSEYPDGTIMNVMQIGYKINDRLIRPAITSVNKV